MRLSDEIQPSEYLFAACELIGSLQKTLSIDSDRVYVSGRSMGGMATWAVVAAYPDKFAAALPLCGSGSVTNAPRMVNIAIWAFHGDADPVIPVTATRRIIAAIKQAGGQPKYTELPGADHFIDEQVFSNPDLLPWVFAQRRRTN